MLRQRGLNPLIWLALAVASAASAYLVGWRAVQGYRAREARDLNADRYLAWRGRARPPAPRGSMREGMTLDERRRAIAGAVLGAIAVLSLAGFFVAS